MPGYDIYALGDVRLQSGAVLRGAELAYATYGTLNAAADNAVLLPTFYTGTHLRNEPLFGPGEPSTPPAISSFRSICSETDIPLRRAMRRPARRPPVSTWHTLRQCRLPASPAHGAARRPADRARARLVDGGDAGLSMGGPISGHGRSDPSLLRRRALLASQPRLPRWSESRLQADAAWNEGNYVTPPEKGLRASAASMSPGPTRRRSSATVFTGRSASPRWRISCATGRRIT